MALKCFCPSGPDEAAATTAYREAISHKFAASALKVSSVLEDEQIWFMTNYGNNKIAACLLLCNSKTDCIWTARLLTNDYHDTKSHIFSLRWYTVMQKHHDFSKRRKLFTINRARYIKRRNYSTSRPQDSRIYASCELITQSCSVYISIYTYSHEHNNITISSNI